MNARPFRNLLPGCPDRPWLSEAPLGPRYGNETRDSRGRVRVTLGCAHRFANSGGWQYRYRLVYAYATGKLPHGSHVDHENGVLDDDRLDNLRELQAEMHGRLHARLWELAGRRGTDGRWRQFETSDEIEVVPTYRAGPVVSARPVSWSTWEPESSTLAERPARGGGPSCT